jgi:hypothetical protein
MIVHRHVAQVAAACKIRQRLRALLSPSPASHLTSEEHAALCRALKQAQHRIDDLRGIPMAAR